jgi:hypothetical protein
MQFHPSTNGLGPFKPIIRVTYDNGTSEVFVVGPEQPTEDKAIDIANTIAQLCRNDVIGRLRNVEQIFK